SRAEGAAPMTAPLQTQSHDRCLPRPSPSRAPPLSPQCQASVPQSREDWGCEAEGPERPYPGIVPRYLDTKRNFFKCVPPGLPLQPFHIFSRLLTLFPFRAGSVLSPQRSVPSPRFSALGPRRRPSSLPFPLLPPFSAFSAPPPLPRNSPPGPRP